MNIILLDEVKTILSNPLSKHNYFGWPTVAKLKNGKIAVAASGYRLGHVCPFGKAVMAFSEDNGNTYTNAFPIIDTVLDDRDAGLCPFGESGLVLTSFNNTRQFQRDCAQDEPEEIKNYMCSYLDSVSDKEEEAVLGSTFRISIDNGLSFGKLHISPITSPHGPTVLQDGSILWVGYSFITDDSKAGKEDYLAAYRINTDGTMEFVGRMDDTYENGVRMYANEPHAIQLPDGNIVCHFRTEQNFTTWQTISEDGGKTWSKAEKLLADRGGAPAHLMLHSSGVLISCYGFRQAPYGIKAMFSTDGGKTWDTDHWLYKNHLSGDLGYPSTIELEDGSLLTVFYAKEKENGPCVIMQQKWKIEQ